MKLLRSFGVSLAFAVVPFVASHAYAACEPGQASQTATARYVVNGGEVFDKTTNLTWRRCSLGQQWKGELGCVGVIKQMTWKDAMAQAQGAWRVPTKAELSSLVASGCTNPAIDEALFPDMELLKLWYWTSTENAASVVYVAFGGGSARDGSRADLNSVRLVRSGR